MSDIVTLNGYKIKDEKAVRSYETVAQMKADTKLKEGYHVKTKGYYEVNDGGCAEYVIVNDETLVDDGGLIHVLNNGLRAKLIESIYKFYEIDSQTSKQVNGDLIIRNTYFTGNGNKLILLGTTDKISFENCIFDNFNIQTYATAEHTFKDCIFKNCSESSLFVSSSLPIKLNIESCIFKHVRPNKEEWNENANSCRAWKFNPINIYNVGCNLKITNSVFEDIIAGHCIYIPVSVTDCSVEITNNKFINTESNAITFEITTKGIINNNTFENIGGIRGTEQYHYPSENAGVGCNALYCLKCYELIATNNTIINVVENGIEGTYKEISNNYIENTGYRYSHGGFITPSTEGIYTSAKIVTGNKIVNPFTHGIVIIGSEFVNEHLITNNNMIANNNLGSGIRLEITDTLKENVIVKDNYIENFDSKYIVTNTNTLKTNNIIIYDNENYIENAQIKNVFDKMKGIKMYSNTSKVLTYNKYFKDTDNGDLTYWLVSAGTLTQDTEDNGNKYGKFLSVNQYGRLYTPTFKLSTDRYTLLCVHLKLKTNKNFSISLISTDDNGTAYATDGAVFSGYANTFESTNDYEDIYLTLKGKGNTYINLNCSEANQEIDIKEFEIWNI